jgi:acyl-CoA thioester hydrolase
MQAMGEPFTVAIQTRVGDVNFTGHVDNVEALRVVDEARMRFFGLRSPRTGEHAPGVMDALADGLLPVVVSHRLEYHQELLPSLVEPYVVRVWTARVGSSSFTLDTTISHAPSGAAPAVVAETTLVVQDLSTGRASEMTPAVRAALEAHERAPLPLRPRPVKEE